MFVVVVHSLTLRCMACFSAFIKVNIFIHSRILTLTGSFSYQLLLHSFVSMVGLEIEMIPSYSPGCEFPGLVLRCPGSYICYYITPLKYHSAEHKPTQSSVILFSFGFPTLMHTRGTFCTYCNYWEIHISTLCFFQFWLLTRCLSPWWVRHFNLTLGSVTNGFHHLLNSHLSSSGISYMYLCISPHLVAIEVKNNHF